MSQVQTTEEAQATEFRTQFISNYATPEATEEIIQSSVAQYKRGEKSYATACVHTHTIENEPKDMWDFIFTHPDFTEENNTGVGTFTSPTGDVYFQRQITTIFRRQFFSTAYPDRRMYHSQTNLPCVSYTEVYNADHFKKSHPNKWQVKLRKYKQRDTGKVATAHNNWRFTKRK